MAHYPAGMTLREARGVYFAQNAFGEDGGYSKTWVKVMLGPVPVYIYNSKMRVDAVRYHDLHHVVTGYSTDLRGEAEIGAWEVASGCGTKLAAWYLNLQAMLLGLIIDPRATFAAFVRGRHSSTLYHEPFSEALLDRTVGQMRTDLGLDRDPPPATTGDRLRFVGWLLAAAMLTLAPLALLLWGLIELVLAWL